MVPCSGGGYPAGPVPCMSPCTSVDAGACASVSVRVLAWSSRAVREHELQSQMAQVSKSETPQPSCMTLGA